MKFMSFWLCNSESMTVFDPLKVYLSSQWSLVVGFVCGFFWISCHQLFIHSSHSCWQLILKSLIPRTTENKWRHKLKNLKNVGPYGRHNMLGPYLKILEWELIFGCAVKMISSPSIHSWCIIPILEWSFTD